MAPKIHTPVPGFTGVVAGVSFHKGTGETDDPAALGYFRRRGYTVDDLAATEPAFPDGVPAESWKVDQLKAYAKAKEIDLGSATKKDDILALLTPQTPTPPEA